MTKPELDQAIAELARALMEKPLTVSQRRIIDRLALDHRAYVNGNQLPAIRRLLALRLIEVDAADLKFGRQDIVLVGLPLLLCVMAQQVIP